MSDCLVPLFKKIIISCFNWIFLTISYRSSKASKYFQNMKMRWKEEYYSKLLQKWQYVVIGCRRILLNDIKCILHLLCFFQFCSTWIIVSSLCQRKFGLRQALMILTSDLTCLGDSRYRDWEMKLVMKENTELFSEEWILYL